MGYEIRTSHKRYIIIKSFVHFGEPAFATGKIDLEKGLAEFYLIKCKHGVKTVWLKREEIGI